jgi:hypothetical protein
LSLTAAATARVVPFQTGWWDQGDHSLQIKVKGTAGSPTVYVDGFVFIEEI